MIGRPGANSQSCLRERITNGVERQRKTNCVGILCVLSRTLLLDHHPQGTLRPLLPVIDALSFFKHFYLAYTYLSSYLIFVNFGTPPVKVHQVHKCATKQPNRLEKKYTTAGVGGGDKYQLCLLPGFVLRWQRGLKYVRTVLIVIPLFQSKDMQCHHSSESSATFLHHSN